MFDAGTRTLSNTISAWPCGASSKPNTDSIRSMRTPGASIGTRIIDCCWCLWRVGVAAAHEDRDPAPWIAGSGDPPLASVDDVVAAVPADRRLDVRRIRGRDVRLRHRETRADVSGEQRLQPLPLLLGRPVADQHFHVAGVGRRAVEDLGRERQRASHDFAERRVFGVGEAGPVFARRQEQIPESLGARLRLELLDERDRLPAIALVDLLFETLLVRVDVRVHEGGQSRLQILHFR